MVLLIGDVQGCAQALERLLALSGFSPSRDRLVVLGDLVNRGPDSMGVLRRLANLGDSAVCLLGNHDLHLLAVAQGARTLHRGDTFNDVLHAADAGAWLEWLRHRPLAHLEGAWLCVHAGVVPQWSAATVLHLAAEVQAQLRGPQVSDFFHHMYGNEPDRWQDSLQGQARWRFITNALTRIRFCSHEGELDLKTKEGLGTAPPGYVPWFEVPGRQTEAQAIAFGHWSTLGLINRPTLLALDTGCVWGGALSAVRVDSGRRELFQVPCEMQQQPGR